MERTITFANTDQANLFSHEITGQLSDGQWENTRPLNHWKPWCEANVAVDATKVGRNFYAEKCNYNLTAPSLLSVIGNRMINIVKIGRAFGAENIHTLMYAFDLDGNFTGGPTYSGKYWDDIRTKLAAFDMTQVAQAISTNPYNRKALKADLEAMKVAMKTWVYA